MDYFLKSVGLSGTTFQPSWWSAKPELRNAVYFGRCPSAIKPDDWLIYYAVQTGGMICAAAKVLGAPTGISRIPPGMTPFWQKKFKWLIPVRVVYRCDADANCPKLSQFTNVPMGPGSYKRVAAPLARRMIAAIARCHRLTQTTSTPNPTNATSAAHIYAPAK